MSNNLCGAFDLNLLPVLLAIYEYKNLERAAFFLKKDLIFLNHSIDLLRKLTNDVLFIQTPNGLQITTKGKELAAIAKDLLTKTELICSPKKTFLPESCMRRFVIAVTDIGEAFFLPPLLAKIQREAPSIKIQTIILPSFEIESALERGIIDFALGYFPYLNGSRLFSQELSEHHFLVLLRSEYALHVSSKKNNFLLDVENYTKLNHILVDPLLDTDDFYVFQDFLVQKNIQRKILLTVSHYAVIPFVLVQANIAVTVPDFLAKTFLSMRCDLCSFPLQFESPKIVLRQHWHRTYHHEPAHKWLRKLIENCFIIKN